MGVPKYVYYFGEGHAEGNAKMKDILGGKGAGLAEMTNIGVPVPPGFTISTEVCTYFYAHDKTYPSELKGAVAENLARVFRGESFEVESRVRSPTGQTQVYRGSYGPVVEKGEEGRCVQVGHPEGRGLDARGLFDKGQQQAERVAATGQGLGTGALMAPEMVGKEGLDMGRKGGRGCAHDASPLAA